MSDSAGGVVGLDLLDGGSRIAGLDAHGAVPIGCQDEGGAVVACFAVDEDDRAWTGAAAVRRALDEPAQAIWRPVRAFFDGAGAASAGRSATSLDPFACATTEAGHGDIVLRGRSRRARVPPDLPLCLSPL